MKTVYQSPVARLLTVSRADILTVSTHDLANLNDSSFEGVDAAKLF